MAGPSIHDLLFDDDNIMKMAQHGVDPVQLLQLLSAPHVVAPNRSTGSAPYLLIGRDDGGACIAGPVTPTHDDYLWRPITAWYCKQSERRRFERG